MLSQKGFGTLEKYIMIWNNEDDLVWPHDVPWFELITPAFSNNSKWTTFSNPTQFKEMPVLCGWVGAQDARDIEAQTDDEILDDVMSNLKSMFPSLSRPDQVFIPHLCIISSVHHTLIHNKPYNTHAIVIVALPLLSNYIIR